MVPTIAERDVLKCRNGPMKAEPLGKLSRGVVLSQSTFHLVRNAIVDVGGYDVLFVVCNNCLYLMYSCILCKIAKNHTLLLLTPRLRWIKMFVSTVPYLAREY